MGDYLFYIALGSVLITITIIIILTIHNKENKQKNSFDVSVILPLFDNANVKKVEFIRNKIVVLFKDINEFDVKTLHLKGATGITIVGDRVKFYVNESIAINESVYKSIKEFVEGK
jgi:hypothetical protein